MKRTFDFGLIDYVGRGEARDHVTVEMSYEKKGEKKCLSICASVYDRVRHDLIMGGQCLDDIAPHLNDPLYNEILRLWKLYHLNDMHPECEHQAALGWREKAKTKVILYNWKLTIDTIRKQNDIKTTIIDTVKAGKSFTPREKDSRVLSLPYSLTTYTGTLSEEIAEFYEAEKPLRPGTCGHTETKALGWLKEEEHPDGLLSRPCPVCGYRYGNSWVYFPIPEKDERVICKLLEEDEETLYELFKKGCL